MATKTVGLDIGSRNITVYLEGKGIIAREPSQIALDINSKEPVSYGQEAVAAARRTPGTLILTNPVFEGSVTDHESMGLILEELFRRLGLGKSDVLVSLNSSTNEAERRAIGEMLFETGARYVGALDIPTACVLGSGLGLADDRALISLNIGSGITEVGLVKGCVTKFSQTVKYGCAKLDAAIAALIRREYNAEADADTIQSIRENVGSVHPSFDAGSMDFTGRDLVTGLPVSLAVSSEQTRAATESIAKYIAAFTTALLRSLPGDIGDEVSQRGVLISGGGALTGGMDTLISETAGVPVTVSELATECVIEGIGVVIENRSIFDVLIHEL